MSVTFLATSVPSEPENFAVTSGFYPIERTSVGVLDLGLINSIFDTSEFFENLGWKQTIFAQL